MPNNLLHTPYSIVYFFVVSQRFLLAHLPDFVFNLHTCQNKVLACTVDSSFATKAYLMHLQIEKSIFFSFALFILPEFCLYMYLFYFWFELFIWAYMRFVVVYFNSTLVRHFEVNRLTCSFGYGLNQNYHSLFVLSDVNVPTWTLK